MSTEETKIPDISSSEKEYVSLEYLRYDGQRTEGQRVNFNFTEIRIYSLEGIPMHRYLPTSPLYLCQLSESENEVKIILENKTDYTTWLKLGEELYNEFEIWTIFCNWIIFKTSKIKNLFY